jgi:hypothetical protein
MFTILAALLAAQAAPAPASTSEVIKTDPKTVVVSDVRHRGEDRSYPRPWNFEEPGVISTEVGMRLCGAAADLEEDKTMPTGWKVEALIVAAAGIDLARDDDATIKRKTAAWLATEGGRNACGSIHALFGGGHSSWMQAMIRPSYEGFRMVDKVILRYGLPLNDVSVRDGRTILDYVADEIDRAQPAQVGRLTRIYGTLRRFGARHRKELELAGTIALPAQRAAQLRAEMARSAEAGNAGAMWALTNLYAAEGAGAQAAQWLERTLARSKATGDSILMSQIGLALVDVEGKAGPPFRARRAEGVALLEAAQRYNNPKENIGLMDDRSFALGWAYLEGQGVPRNEAAGLKYLASSSAKSARHAALYLLQRGRRLEAIKYLRGIRGPGFHWAFVDGKTIDQWLAAQPEGICGPDIQGGNPCK